MVNGYLVDYFTEIKMSDSKLRGLYAITDATLMADNFELAIEQCLQGGTRIIQYRDKSEDSEKRLKQAKVIREFCNQYQALFIVNDDIELAIATDADGIHLGKDDLDIKAARKQLGTDKIIGITCYNQLQNAIEAEHAGADYVAFGAFFSSSIKPNATDAPLSLIKHAKDTLQIPICCIGGITADNAKLLIDEGADMLAIISDIFANKNTAKKNDSIGIVFINPL